MANNAMHAQYTGVWLELTSLSFGRRGWGIDEFRWISREGGQK